MSDINNSFGQMLKNWLPVLSIIVTIAMGWATLNFRMNEVEKDLDIFRASISDLQNVDRTLNEQFHSIDKNISVISANQEKILKVLERLEK